MFRLENRDEFKRKQQRIRRIFQLVPFFLCILAIPVSSMAFTFVARNELDEKREELELFIVDDQDDCNLTKIERSLQYFYIDTLFNVIVFVTTPYVVYFLSQSEKMKQSIVLSILLIPFGIGLFVSMLYFLFAKPFLLLVSLSKLLEQSNCLKDDVSFTDLSAAITGLVVTNSLQLSLNLLIILALCCARVLVIMVNEM